MTVWLDPGKTTGIAAWYHRFDMFSSMEADFKAAGQWLTMLAQFGYGDSIVNQFTSSPIELGWEAFITTPGTVRRGGKPDYSLEVIGMARWLCLEHGMTILPAQISSQMALGTDARLKAMGWYKPGKPHANDAARHLLVSLFKRGLLLADLKEKAFVRPNIAEFERWVDEGMKEET